MQDYQANSKKARAKAEQAKPVVEKQIERIEVGEIIIRKKSVGRKFRDLVKGMDIKTVARNVVTEVLYPGAKNIIYDMGVESLRGALFKDGDFRRAFRSSVGRESRVTLSGDRLRRMNYNEISRIAPARETGPRRSSKVSRDEIILHTREDAQEVLEGMTAAIEAYDYVTVQDLKEMLGLQVQYTDNKFGWVYLGDVSIRQIPEGYLLDLPDPEPVDPN